MEVLKFIYENSEIEFLSSGSGNVMVNATQMAKVFDKRISFFLKSDHAKAFISELELSPFGDRSAPLKREEIIKTVNGVNTWMHRILALKFAAWLDTKFELWVYSTIDKVILGTYHEHREATIEQIETKQAIERKREELLTKYPEFMDFVELEKKLTATQKRRLAAMRESVRQLKLNFF